jgi:hypothetical protein
MSGPFRLNKIDRRKGFAAGVLGGIVGVAALQLYWKLLPANAFGQLPHAEEPVAFADKLPEIEPLFGQRHMPGEAATATVGRIAYRAVTGHAPRTKAERAQLRALVLWGWGMAMGAAYGSTRTTTRARDIAGGFFYGLRLWVGDAVLARLLGLKRDPRQWPLQRHLVWLTGHWVYSFVTANVTRVLYRKL